MAPTRSCQLECTLVGGLRRGASEIEVDAGELLPGDVVLDAEEVRAAVADDDRLRAPGAVGGVVGASSCSREERAPEKAQ